MFVLLLQLIVTGFVWIFEAVVGLEAYGDVMNWDHVYMKNSNSNCRMIHSSSSNGQEYCEEDAEVVQSKQQRWAYVKVNMDGVIVGRKVCIFQHGCYSSLALQLEDMFGMCFFLTFPSFLFLFEFNDGRTGSNQRS